MSGDVQPTPPVQETERDRYNFDVGFEAGHQERGAEDRTTALLQKMRGVIVELINELDEAIAEDKANER